MIITWWRCCWRFPAGWSHPRRRISADCSTVWVQSATSARL